MDENILCPVCDSRNTIECDDMFDLEEGDYKIIAHCVGHCTYCNTDLEWDDIYVFKETRITKPCK